MKEKLEYWELKYDCATLQYGPEDVLAALFITLCCSVIVGSALVFLTFSTCPECNIFFVAVASCAVAFVMLPVMNMTMKAKIDNFFIVFTFLLNKMFLYSRVYLSFANLIVVTKKTLG